jgi:hypothetical protein
MLHRLESHVYLYISGPFWLDSARRIKGPGERGVYGWRIGNKGDGTVRGERVVGGRIAGLNRGIVPWLVRPVVTSVSPKGG